ncbi:MAG: nicotinate-nicotinamide nucleotide adenylyltransferase [Methylacidiphilales bacterium]|nr:nicotinate-nicotinamide nucleotide adenylyltransferase [Candidatus Methylacidiphilales bacterium]
MDRLEIKPSKTLCIYGGAFDPPHRGHLHCVLIAKKYFPNAKIIVLPTPTNTTSKNTKSSFYHRFKMVKLLMPPYVYVSAIEQRRKFIYSYQTLRYLKQGRFKQYVFQCIIGDDQLTNFTNWEYWKKILTLAHLFVIPRLLSKSAIDTLCVRLRKQVPMMLGVSVASQKPVLISSTHLRESVFEPPPNIRMYSKKNKLYRYATYS